MTGAAGISAPPYGHLLCPVDFSDVSRAALEWALGFARETGARLTLLHVIDTRVFSVGNLVAVPGSVRQMREKAEEVLTAWRHDLDFGNARVEVVDGVPADAIVSSAHENEVDLVVMATSGLGGFQKLLLGSVTEKVLHRMRVPLLTLSPKVVEGELKAFVRPRTVVMALDLGEDSPTVIRHGVWLAEHYRARLVAVHAVPIPSVLLDDRTLQMVPVEELVTIEGFLVEERRKKLVAMLPRVETDVDIVVTVGPPFDVLRALARERSADLMVMGAGGWGPARLLWLGSTSHKMVRSAECPVLIAR
jgi:nucleotide-binding universal stress UspA family protein